MALALLIAVALVPALVGARVAVGMLTSRESALAPAAAGSSVGEFVATGFGYMGVRDVERVPSSLPRGLFEPRARDIVVVQALVALADVGRRPLPYSPTQFLLRRANGPAAVPEGFPAGTLRPYTRTNLSLRFTVPRRSSQLRLEYREPGRLQPRLFDLTPRNLAGKGGRPYDSHPAHP